MRTRFTHKGYIFLIGGAEDRDGDRSVLRTIIEKTSPANIAIIPTASAYPKEVDRCYTGVFSDLGVNTVRCLDIRYRDEAERPELLDAVEAADLIYFGGGDQAKLVDTLIGTRLFERIQSRFDAGSLHIAGTSAGASAIGDPIFYDGDRRGLEKGSIGISRGFGLIDAVAVDTHFSARNRLERLCQFLVSGTCRRGIGLDEDTGIMVYPNLHFEVFGTGMVTVVNSTYVTGSNYAEAREGDHLIFNNMRIGYLPPGTRFSIKRWSILTRPES
ncbi:MAG: cyanophycinase [Desulfobacteraceae bacterium]|nr:cyanophycinase [Desulfobacteraceae bacterium]